MANLDNRVLSRQGARELARELTATETESVSAGFSGTNICSFTHMNVRTTTVTGLDCDIHDSDTGNDVS